jgi:glycosyltransferase involved in cell wall biosynthesis
VGDAPGLSEGVLRVLSDPAFRQKLVNEARCKAELFSFRKTAARTKEIYEQILSK